MKISILKPFSLRFLEGLTLDIGAKMEADFEATMALSQRMTLEDVRKEKTMTKVLGWTMKIFAPLM